MSLNNLSLPAPLLADLYKNLLVEGSARPVPKEVSLPYLGKNKKNILIIIERKEAAYLPEKELSFLTNVLVACGLDLSCVAIINVAHANNLSFSQLQSQFSPKEILLLGVDPTLIGLANSQLYAVQEQEGLRYVVAPALAQIEKTKQEKSNLWLALKQLFRL